LQSVSYKDSNGLTQVVTFSYSTYTFTPSFALPSFTPTPKVGPMLTQITYPNGLSYHFDYNSFGELSKVTFPAGGYKLFDFATVTVYGGFDTRRLVAVHACSSPSGTCGTEDTTLYNFTAPASSNQPSFVDVINPLSERIQYQFSSGQETQYEQSRLVF